MTMSKKFDYNYVACSSPLACVPWNPNLDTFNGVPSETIQLKTLFGHQLTFSFGIAKIFNIAHNGDSVTNVALDWI